MEMNIIYGTLLFVLLYSTCAAQVTITRPPEDTTACRGSEVIISCGHNSTTEFDTIWSINGSGFSSIAENDPSYRLSNQTLTVFSIDYTTTFQCSVRVLQSQPPIILTSTLGTVTVVDRPVVEITTATAVCGYVNVSWTATGNNDVYSPVQYNVTLSSTSVDMITSITSMNAHNFTDLPDDTQFTVTVIGINMMGVVSDPVSTSLDIYRPVVEIKTATAGCEYVSVSWTATGNNDVCSPVQYNVTLSSSTIETVLITSMNTHNFTELPDDTQFTVTVISINMMGVASDPVSTAVTTNENCEKPSNDGDINNELHESESDSLSTGAVVVITFTVTFIVSVTATAIITFIVTYHCVKRKFNPNNQSPQEKVLYEQVISPSHSINKDNVEIQKNPAYGSNAEALKGTTPVYESCK